MSSPFPPFLDSLAFGKRLRRSSQVLGMMVALVVALLLSLMLYMLHSLRMVEHSDRVLIQVRSVEKDLLVMQSSFRGFRLSGDQTYLTGFTEGISAGGVPDRLKELAGLVAGDPHQEARAGGLKDRVETWFRFVLAELRSIDQQPALRSNSDFLKTSVPMFELATQSLTEISQEEMALRQRRAERMNLMVGVILTGFAIASLIGIPALSLWVRRLLLTLKQSYAASLLTTAERAEELRVTLHSIGDAVVVTNATGEVSFINPVAEHLMGWTQEEANGKPLPQVFEIYDESTLAPAENPVERVLRENVIVGLANHTVLRSKDGQRTPIEDSAAPIRRADGSLLGVVLVFRDVAAKHAAEQALQASESRLGFINRLGDVMRDLPDSDAVVAQCVAMLGTFLLTSRCAYAAVDPATGGFSILHDYVDGCPSTVGDYQLSDFGPRAAAKMWAGETLVIRNRDAELPESDGRAAFRAIGIEAIICCPLHKAGKLRAMMAVHQTAPRQWTDSEVALVESVVERCWTMVERKRAEADLVIARETAESAARIAAESAQRFRQLGDLIALQVWTARPNGDLNYVNEQCLKYFGTDNPDQVLGTAWAAFVHPDDLPEALTRWQHSLKTGEPYHSEFRLCDGEKQFRWFLVRAEALRDPNGTVTGWFGTNTAIGELKLAQQEAERANLAKDKFLAALSHELRTPLTPVLMTAAALREDPRLPADVQEKMGMMERNIALEARLIDDLLDLTAISKGKLKLRREMCDAHSLIGLAVEIVRSEAQAKGLVLEQQFQAPSSGLNADPARFQQVIWNLLRNAVKFTPPGGKITIRTYQEIDVAGAIWLSVAVVDSGIGIDPASLGKIFLPFEQAGTAGDHRFGGVGLGLSIASAIVKLHGGRIRANSAGPHQGSTFVVEFPDVMEPPSGVVPCMPVEDSDREKNVSGLAAAGLRILLVEDHPATLDALTALLKNAGHQVVAARSVGAGLQAAAENEFDLLISDLGLPDGTGIQLMERLRKTLAIPAIALSGYGMEDDLERCRGAGFSTHLVKPVRFADLQRAIQQVI